MNKLLLRLQSARSDYRAAQRTMRRARQLYVRFVRKAIEADKTSRTLNLCSQRMVDSGMYAPNKAICETRFAILREMCRQDGCWNNWYRWYMQNGFASYTFDRAMEAA